MARIKVVGYMVPDEMSQDDVDFETPTGLSESGLDYWTGAFSELEDITFTLVES